MTVIALTSAVVADRALAQPAGGDPFIAAAGDIACDPANANYNGGKGTADACRQRATSNLLVGQGYAAVLPLGDLQYEDGALSQFQASYDPTWGRVKPISRPVTGNHEYLTSGAAGYFDYFNGVGAFTGAAGDRGKGYYSFDVGAWHLIALNSNCGAVGGCGAGSNQDAWLRADLAAHAPRCTLAYWHHPRFNSSWTGEATNMQVIWQELYTAGVDLVLNGHAHDYERFAPQDLQRRASMRTGMREIIVGTGGEDHSDFGSPKPNSEVRDFSAFGILRLQLHPTSYHWRFSPAAGATFTDSGTTDCH